MSDLVAWLHKQVDVDAEIIARHNDPDVTIGPEGLDVHYDDTPPYSSDLLISGKRALAEVEFKRKLLADYENDVTWDSGALRYMAEVYAGRDGYEEAISGECGEPVGSVDLGPTVIEVTCKLRKGHDGAHTGHTTFLE